MTSEAIAPPLVSQEVWSIGLLFVFVLYEDQLATGGVTRVGDKTFDLTPIVNNHQLKVGVGRGLATRVTS
jgi:hypothetical protein